MAAKTFEIHASIGKMFLLVAGSIGFIIGGGFLISTTDIIGIVVGVAAIVFFGVCGLIGLWRLCTLRGPVVTLWRKGIQDIRIAPETIPWREVRDISTWRGSGQKVMDLHVDQSVLDDLTLTEIARRSEKMNRSLGAHGFTVSSTELKISHEALVTKTMEFWHAARGR